MLRKLAKCRKGFTLIELMIVMTIVGILASLSVPNYNRAVIRAREAVLRETLYSFRSTIDQFYADQGKYPDSLSELVEKHYLRDMPTDPFTKAKDGWQTVAPQSTSEGGDVKGNVYDVHSGSNVIGTDGRPYSEW